VPTYFFVVSIALLARRWAVSYLTGGIVPVEAAAAGARPASIR
jgi:hypothetical protein